MTLGVAAMLMVSGPAGAEDMSGDSLRSLLANGLTVTLGGPGEGYSGALRLEADGTGVGAAMLKDGKVLDITGTWTIEGDKFCRQWAFDKRKKTCETWRVAGENKVNVMVKAKESA